MICGHDCATSESENREAELVGKLGPRALATWRKVTDALAALYLEDAPEVVRVAAGLSSEVD